MPEALTASDALYTKEELNAHAKQAHLLRLQDRIAFFRQRLPTVSEKGERTLILVELTKYESQLQEAMKPKAATPAPGLLQQAIHALQQEVASLKAMLLPPAQPNQETHGPLAVGSEPEAPAEAPKA